MSTNEKGLLSQEKLLLELTGGPCSHVVCHS